MPTVIVSGCKNSLELNNANERNVVVFIPQHLWEIPCRPVQLVGNNRTE